MNLVLVLYVVTIIMALWVGYKLKVSWVKVALLILFPPFLLGLLVLFEGRGVGSLFMMMTLGLLFMLPALVVYAVLTHYVVVKYKLGYISQLFLGGFIGYFSGFIHTVIAYQKVDISQIYFALISMVTGAISIVLLEYLNEKNYLQRSKNETL